MKFANPSAFALLWFIPILLLLGIYFEYRSRKLMSRAFGGRLAPYLTASVSASKRKLKLVLRCLALFCFVVALARPQLGKSVQEIKARGVEIVIAVDVSNSMLAEDVKPSRLEHAKAELSKLLDMMSGDKVGLIAFAGSAALLSPLTTDIGSLKMFIESLSTQSVATQGTSFRDALDEAKSAFERGGVENDEQVRVTKVILLASDGEDNEPGAIEMAKKLVADGVRIFAIAFGTEKGGAIPIRDERGFLSGYKRDKNGQNVITQVHGNFLRELAQVGKGSFRHATFGGIEAKEIKAELDKLEKAEFSSTLSTNYDERFQVPLAIGILLALIDFAIGERRRAGRIWKGRFEVSES